MIDAIPPLQFINNQKKFLFKNFKFWLFAKRRLSFFFFRFFVPILTGMCLFRDKVFRRTMLENNRDKTFYARIWEKRKHFRRSKNRGTRLPVQITQINCYYTFYEKLTFLLLNKIWLPSPFITPKYYLKLVIRILNLITIGLVEFLLCAFKHRIESTRYKAT